jgi:hypothetical protein
MLAVAGTTNWGQTLANAYANAVSTDIAAAHYRDIKHPALMGSMRSFADWMERIDESTEGGGGSGSGGGDNGSGQTGAYVPLGYGPGGPSQWHDDRNFD